jgi:hypothetical protein
MTQAMQALCFRIQQIIRKKPMDNHLFASTKMPSDRPG